MISSATIPFVIPKWGVFLLAQILSILQMSQPPSMNYYHTEKLHEEYDYVIVGGGSAGCVLANRLSADRGVSVLLIEAGGPEDATTEVPLYALLHYHGPYDWNYVTEKQEHSCLSLKDQILEIVQSKQQRTCVPFETGHLGRVQRSPWPRGKALGGSSVINFMLYVRGNRRDYDSWAHDYGAKGWSYDEVLPHFKNIEKCHIKEYSDNGYHGTRGELPCAYASSHSPVSDVFLEAGQELGYPLVDYNGPSQTGFSRMQTNVLGGTRHSACKSFIKPVISQRRNLHISLLSQVTKVLFEGRRAVGVLFEHGADKMQVRARREVIISAGTIGSPHLLLLSGIGPRKQLEEFGIPVVADLPVGENLQDHVFVGGVAATTKKRCELQLNSASIIVNYALRKEGPFAVPAGIEAVAFVSTSYVNASLDFPDVQIVLLSVSPASEEGERFLTDTGLTKEAYEKYYRSKRHQYAFQLAPILNRLKSRGYIRLRSTDPDDSPIIDPQYFTHPEDIKVAAEGEVGKLNIPKPFTMYSLRHDGDFRRTGARKAVEILRTEAFAKMGTKLWNVPFPGCEEAGEMWSEPYLECLARHHTSTVWHPCCTCPMGEDHRAVVDSRLRVRGGVEGLRVVDASVMPTIVTANLNVPVHMIADRAATFIREDYEGASSSSGPSRSPISRILSWASRT
ncbi:oxygen-dependent choline dehydrogenase-like [Dermacentor silvarum]|uniref:oxygen-dependent choline dehydrogenase-like n=1 Tax=Dermacentor silvarum TaxID=543639 RepID=UPI0021012129|nr:oxygen-dependent choline dehydrogenase-like [Dermacentor silvarum]